MDVLHQRPPQSLKTVSSVLCRYCNYRAIQTPILDSWREWNLERYCWTNISWVIVELESLFFWAVLLLNIYGIWDPCFQLHAYVEIFSLRITLLFLSYICRLIERFFSPRQGASVDSAIRAWASFPWAPCLGFLF